MAGLVNKFAKRYTGSDLLTGAIYRLTPITWQLDWTFMGEDLQTRSFGFSTTTLDRALVAIVEKLKELGQNSG